MVSVTTRPDIREISSIRRNFLGKETEPQKPANSPAESNRASAKILAEPSLSFDYRTEDLKLFLGEASFKKFNTQLENQNPGRTISQTDYDSAFFKYVTSRQNESKTGVAPLQDIATKEMNVLPSLLIYSAGQEVPDTFEHKPRLTEEAIKYLVLDDDRSGLASQFRDFAKLTNYNISTDAKRDLFYDLAMRVLRGRVIKDWQGQNPESPGPLYQARLDALKRIELIEKNKETSMLTSKKNIALTGAAIAVLSTITAGKFYFSSEGQVTKLKEEVGIRQSELIGRRNLSVLKGDTIPTSTQKQAFLMINPTEQEFFWDLSNALIEKAKLRFPDETERNFTFLIGNLTQNKIRMTAENAGTIHISIPVKTFQELHQKVTNTTEISKPEKLLLELPAYL